MTLNRRSVLALLAAGTLAPVLAAPVYALDPKSTAPINLDKTGLALRGYDPVNYFTAGKPSLGAAAFRSQWDGATYAFATAANKALFDATPEKYVPKYGGFCAYATSQGYKADADPTAWKIVDGRLYVNYDHSVAKHWASKQTAYIKTAEMNWPKVQSLLPR